MSEAAVSATPMPAFGRSETLIDLFRRARARHPGMAAVASAEATLSYAELDRLSDLLAARLIQALAHESLRNQVIGLCVGRSPAIAVGILGIIKAGGAWLPLEPALPRQRLRSMLSDSGARAVVGDDEGLEQLGPTDSLTQVRALSGDAPQIRLPDGPAPDDAAYVIYTSGSTGSPKGVVVEHASAARMASALATVFGLQAGMPVAAFASIAFDALVADIFSAFAAAATIHIPDDLQRRSLPALAAFLDRQRIEVVTLPPAMLNHMERRPLAALKTLVVAGETGRGECLDWWAQRCRVVNAYGPTEATVCACATEYHPGDPPARIGRALPHARLEVLDAVGDPVPIGKDGELFIGGGGVARGYLGWPQLTAERFVALPGRAGRFFRTGDRVRWLEAGVLEFRGRLDDQVKISGNRVEPDEVARRIEAIDNIAQAAVVAVGEPGELQLVAVYTGAAVTPAPEQIRARLADTLPDWMVPARYVWVAELPLNQNGKLDRAALAALAATPEARAADPPRTPTESAIAAIWGRVLRLGNVSRDDSFYALGGDSLRLTEMLVLLNRTLGTAVVAARVRRLATLADLAAHIDATTGATRDFRASQDL